MRFVYLAAILLCITGCTLLDTAFGVNPDGTSKPGGGILGTVASLVNYWIPGAAGLLGTATTVYAALRGKKWKEAFVATAKVVEAKAGAEIKEELGVAHAAAGVSTLVEKALDKFVRKEA